MASIATLTIDLIGKSAKLTAELNKANKNTKSWADKTRKMVNVSSKVMAGFGVTGVAALTAIYAKNAAFIDQQAKTADRLGITTQALGGLQHAANLYGASNEELNKSLQTMQKNLGQLAQTGTGEAKYALDGLGLSVKDLQGLAPEEQFKVIADKLKNVEDQSQKVYLAQSLMGKSGAKMINVMDAGADGITAMMEEADALGMTFTRVDAAKVEMANDALDKAQKTTHSFGQTLAIEMAPIVGAISELFIENAKEAGGFGQVAQQAIGKVTSVIGVMADGIHGIKVLFNAAKVIAMGFSTVLWEGLALVVNKGLVPFANAITNNLLYPIRKVLELSQHIPGIGDSAKSALTELNKLGKAEGFKTLDSIGAQAFNNLKQAKDDLHNSMMEPLPSKKIEGWIADVQTKFQTAAEKQVNDSKKPGLSDLLSTDEANTKDNKKAEDEKKRAQSLVDAARTQYQQIFDAQLEFEGKEVELENRRYERKITQMEQEFQLLRDKNLVTTEIESEYRLAKEQLEAQHKETLLEVEKQNQQQMMQGYSQLLSVAESYFDGMEGKKAGYARSAIALGQILLDEEKRNALQSIFTNTYDTAMKAYNALAGIPYVGPALGVAAAGAVITAGGLYAGKVSGLASFDGGGYTGDGPRIGGVDGGGGLYAIVHPQETVVDHTKGQNLGSSVTVNIIEDASRAGTQSKSNGLSGKDVIDVFVSNIREGGEASSVLELSYGLQRQGI